jgi:hypothetical protein
MKNQILSILILALISTPLLAESGDGFFSNAGLRIGVDTESSVNLSSYELYGTSESLWSWELTENLNADLQLETAIGVLTGEGETAAYVRFAPVLEVSADDFPVSFILSSGPTLYSQATFDQYDLGGNIHFTSSIGLNWNTYENWTLGYRFQHTSNANLRDPNPGLEMHTLSLERSF